MPTLRLVTHVEGNVLFKKKHANGEMEVMIDQDNNPYVTMKKLPLKAGKSSYTGLRYGIHLNERETQQLSSALNTAKQAAKKK